MARIFICYSHKDEDWKDRVVAHLLVGAADQTVVWSDERLRGGDAWQSKIREAIAAADVAVILVSSNSLTSNFILRKEVPAILQGQGRRVIPLIVKDCDWNSVDWLSDLQVLPQKGPLEAMTPAGVNTELAALKRMIRELEASTSSRSSTQDAGTDLWRPPAELDSYEALFVSAARAGPVDRAEAVRHTLSQMREQAPELADVASRCAIPRLFDADVLGVVRGKPEDTEENAALLRRMVEYTFVQPRRGGGYEYERDVRRFLLEDWKSDVIRAETFEALNRDLANFYWRSYEKSHQAEEREPPQALGSQPASAGGTVANRFGAAPLAEALYHLGSCDAICEFFEQRFDEALEKDRFTTCEALLETTRAGLNRIANGAEALDKVLLRESRFLARTQRTARAIQNLKELLAAKGNTLARSARQEALTDLGYLLAEGDDLKGACGAFEEALALTERPDATELDRASAHYSLASPYWTTNQYDRALYEFGEAINLAGDRTVGVYARVEASAVLGVQGRWQESWHTGLEALHLQRTKHRQNRSLADIVARQMMLLVGSRSPALIDTLFAEVVALHSPQTTRMALDARRDYAVALRVGGQLARATEQLRQLRRQASSHPDPAFATQLLLQISVARIDERRLEEGIDICSEVLSRVREGKGALADEAMARLNRAMATVERIRAQIVPSDSIAMHWSYVAEDARKGSELYLKRGDRRLAAVAKAYEELAGEMNKDVPRAPNASDGARRGDEATAAELLGAPEYFAYYHMTRADIDLAHGRLHSARANYRRASEFFDKIARYGDAAQSVELCAAMAERTKDYAEAARLRTEVGHRRWQLAEIDRYRPSNASVRADEHHAAGVLAMSSGEGSDVDNLQRACASFRAARAEATPVQWFYDLNLAYACAALGDWEAAAQALDSSLGSGPTWWRVPKLEALLREFEVNHLDRVVAQGDRDFREGRVQEASATSETVLASLERSSRDDGRRFDVQARLALVYLLNNDLPRASAMLTEVLAGYRRAHGSAAASAFGRACRAIVVSVQQYRTLMTRLRAAESLAADDELRRELRVAQQELTACLSGVYELEPRSSSGMLPIVRTVVLELGDGLIPSETSTAVWNLFTEYIPAFSARLKDAIGIEAPSVLVRRGNPFSTRQYRILIDEIRVADSEAPAGHPEPIAFIVEHLEGVVRAHLWRVVGLQEIDALIDSWQQSRFADASTLAQPDVRVALARVLRALLHEEVPLTQPGEILPVVLAAPSDATSELVQTIRLRLKPLLAGNAVGGHRVLIPEGLEESLRPASMGKEGEAEIPVSPVDAHRVLAKIREWIAGHPRGTAVVVRHAKLRNLLRRLIEAEFPDTPVLAQEELLEQVPTSLAATGQRDEPRPAVT
jgi:tetratricopeptide (TPR) repeat protein